MGNYVFSLFIIRQAAQNWLPLYITSVNDIQTTAVVFYLSSSGSSARSVAQWLGRWTCDWRSRVQSQPLPCRVQLWTSCSHTLSSAFGVTTLWRYINQFKILKKLARVNAKNF